MFELEKRGVPTVGWTAQRFANDAKASSRAFGLDDIALAIIPLPATNQSEETITKWAVDSIDQVIDGLTKPMVPKLDKVTVRTSEILEFQGEDLLEASQKMNQTFLEKAWSDGLPLVPPTPKAVDAMLSGTSLGRDRVLCLLEPDFGIATLEKIAINAVMAGCRPEHLAVVIAAVQCLADPRMMLRNFAMSTAPHAPLILINGPIAKKLNINSKSCALGPGSISYANTVIGRSIRLIMMNVGHCYPGTGDMDTIGSPTKFSMCVAENEDDSPWEPFHVERGYDRETSTVTVHFNYGLCDLADAFSKTPDGLIRTIGGSATNLGHITVGTWLQGHRTDQRYNVEVKDHDMILMCPDHARLFASFDWNKDKVRQALWKAALLPAKLLFKDIELIKVGRPELMWLEKNPDLEIPILETPDCYHIAVVGADVGRGLYTWGAGDAVTKPIEAK